MLKASAEAGGAPPDLQTMRKPESITLPGFRGQDVFVRVVSGRVLTASTSSSTGAYGASTRGGVMTSIR